MTPERYDQVIDLYRTAAELDPQSRAAFLESACAGDEALRREVESLLGYQSSAEGFLQTPALEMMARKITAEQSGLSAGQQISRYRIVSQLGAGGMGEVYLAEDAQLRRQVALKILPSAFTHDPERLRRFQNEARAAAALNHPNIAILHTVEEAEGRHFITMEYVEGQTLARLIAKEGITLTDFFDWFVPLSEALIHAHEKGIVHRDIKPGNVIVTPDGTPKLLDLGLARITRKESAGDVTSTMSMTGDGVVMGTPSYMSPEQAEGIEVDHRSDIFSLGVVMHESLTGERPFKGDNYAAVISELIKSEPAAVADLRPDAPFLLSRLVARCLKKDRRHRHQTMREVRAILEEAKAEVENRAAAKSETAMESKKMPRPAIAAQIVLLALAIVFVIWSLMWLREEESKPIIRFSVSPPPGQQSPMSEAQLSPDGKYIVFSTRRGDLNQLFIRALDQFESRALTGTEGARNPFFSPDSQWIGFFVDDKLKKIPIAGGSTLTICDPCKTAFETYWAGDDTIIASDSIGLYRVSAGGGKPERLTTVDESTGERSHRAPQMLPDGKALLFTIETSKGPRAALLSMDSLQANYLEDAGEALLAQYLSTGHLIFARSNRLMATTFDAYSLKVTSAAAPVLDGVFSSPNFRVAQNGTLVYLPDTAMKENSLVWVDREGQAEPLFATRANNRSPRLSPDGRRIAVQVDNDIWVYEVESARGVRLTFEGENQSPVWTPDGKQIVFASKRSDTWRVYSRAIDSSTEPEILLTSEYRHLPYTCSPDCRPLALVVTYSPSNTDILMLAEDRKTAPFVNTPFIEDTPRFSPDGRWLAYFSMESGQAEVFVNSYPNRSGKVPVSRGGGMFPVWSPDGQELFYRSGGKLYAVAIKPGADFTAGQPRVLFEGPYLIGYDTARDGARFLMVRNEQGSMPTQLNVVLNWTEEFRRVFPSK